mmetsp:Transcript_4053/g.6282  ORF Transcript_4053/g.6282 Transcript_4053/m.6282 type:complete len:107 (-) Transcript_4053:145-465(-)|eukprot:CAMPEP_0185025858 /NCGR_PEP_ID=MMETSP1103-20130426/9420_1 /TAXON_ID=36769 /ORGANISM="Paraphysomonas bandaiensis, Strain Caron Lab Isolate" /LENGTH=106 /DNA_ID=CAMNT_0027559231 /DNA_START=45 /DNA_END=365 /DNA_ORIENTATION=+
MTMYVRLKRKNQTVFLHLDGADNFFQVKSRLGDIFGMEPEKIQLIASDKKRELLDMATVSDQEVKNDDILYFVFQKETGSGFEELQVDSLTHFGEEKAEDPSGMVP